MTLDPPQAHYELAKATCESKTMHVVDRSRDLYRTVCGRKFYNSEDADGRLPDCMLCRVILAGREAVR